MTTDPAAPRRFLTDAEAAEFMNCPVSRVVRLRRTGRLPFLPGRPPSIDFEDLARYAAEEKDRQQREAKARWDVRHIRDRPATREEIVRRIHKNAMRRRERESKKRAGGA